MKNLFFKNFFALFVLFATSSTFLFGDGGSDYVRIKNAYDLRHTDLITVVDGSAGDNGGFSLLRSKKIRFAKVDLIYSRDNNTDVFGPGNPDWEYDVELDVKDKYNNIIGNPTLHIETGGTAKYKASFRVQLPNGHQNAKFDIKNIIASSDGETKTNGELFQNSPNGIEWIRDLLPEDVRIEFTIEVEQHYFLSEYTVPFVYFEGTTTNELNFDYNTANDHRVNLYWPFVFGAEEYELQIAFIDDQTDVDPTPEEIFENSISIFTSNTWYTPEVIYPKGDVHFRIRAIGRYIYGVGDDYSKIKYSRWSPSKILHIINNDFEEDYNWELSQTFAEDGKRKSIITYYDQSLRSRQVISNLSTEDAALVAENKYDYEGRAALTILPSPPNTGRGGGLDDKLFYKNNNSTDFPGGGFNRIAFDESYEKEHFDKNGFADPLGINTNLGTAGYYSQLHPEGGIHDELVPKAKGFPFTQTRYSRDGTGRVIAQGGVGPDFQIGSGHETRYFYGSANSTELERLFGPNVGDATHYKKNVVVDPNGQVNVSYIDQAGRVIATAMADDAPDQLEPIYGSDEANLTVNLDDRHVIDLENRKSTLDYTIIFATDKIPAIGYSFTYDLTGANQLITNPFDPVQVACETCKYRLTLRVYDPEGIVMPAIGNSTANITTTGVIIEGDDPCFGTTYTPADNPFKLDIEISKAGEYRVSKTLELITDPFELDFLQDAGVLQDSLIIRDNYFQENVINPVECITSCEQCETLFDLYPSNPNLDEWYAYCVSIKCPCTECANIADATLRQQCYDDCAQLDDLETILEETRCNGMLERMKADVSPGGWMNDNDAFLIDPEHRPNGAPSDADDIREQWQSGWADIYVTHHREYCHYEFCSDSGNLDLNSDKFNRSLQKASENWDASTSWLQIKNDLNNPTLNPIYDLSGIIELQAGDQYIGVINWSTVDPFFSIFTSGEDRYDQMEDYIENAINTDLNNSSNLGFIEFFDAHRADYSWTPVQEWNVFVASYINAKGQVRDAYIENELSCEFQDDDRAIVSRSNPIPLDLEEAEAYVGDDLFEQCENVCNSNVTNWMYYLEEQCPDAFQNNTAQFVAWREEVRSLLTAYCLNGCNYGINPYGIISDQIRTLYPDVWDLLNAAEGIIDNDLFANSNCPIDPNDANAPHGLLNNVDGSIEDEFDTGITYTYTDYVDIPGADGPPYCEPCEILGNYIDFGEWILVDETEDLYEWRNGYWNIAGLKDFLLANSSYFNNQYEITPYHIFEAIKDCISSVYEFHEDPPGCSFYFDNLDPYLANFLGCPGTWSIDGFADGTEGSICDLPLQNLPGQTAMFNIFEDIKNCGKDVIQEFFDRYPNDGIGLSIILEEFNEHFGINFTLAQLQEFKAFFDSDCGGCCGPDCNYPTVPTNENVLTSLDGLPCSGITSVVTSVGIPTITDPPTPETTFQECIDQLTTQYEFGFDAYYEDLWDEALTNVNQERVDQCFDKDHFSESLYYSYTDLEYQYTLYYYDQAGNLVQTVPPQGVDRLAETDFNNGVRNPNAIPQHKLITQYKYNSFNKVIAQSTPETRDAANSIEGGKFIYDRLGRVRFSQDAEQGYINNDIINDVVKISYTKYDDLGRIIEAGVIENPGQTIEELADEANDPNYPDNSLVLSEVIKTVYDNENTISGVIQENLRNRVSSSENENVKTIYSYDTHGKVKTLVHELKDQTLDYGQSRFAINYEYDLISGNINRVIFQPGFIGEKPRNDQFVHRYEYDADNRLTHLYTSKDGLIWEDDARYFYYLHGPLARVELGDDKVQGQDYYYTLQGWVKGMNSLYDKVVDASHNGVEDFGKDGLDLANNPNRYLANDELAYGLGYYFGDYESIFYDDLNEADIMAHKRLTFSESGLYNGNIKWMQTNLDYFQGSSGSLPAANQFGKGGLQAMVYGYDQLHRIKSATPFFPYLTAPGSTGHPDYPTATGYLYDIPQTGNTFNQYDYYANGNLKSLVRATTQGYDHLDELSYIYGDNALLQNPDPEKANILIRVDDNTSLNPGDPDQGVLDQEGENYKYDKIGNLLSDNQGKVDKIVWNHQNKVEQIDFAPGATNQSISFTYDALGNRLSKTITHSNGTTDTDFYIRDADGNMLSLYEKFSFASTFGVNQKEAPIYGSSRIGIQKFVEDRITYPSSNIPGQVIPQNAHTDNGSKRLELNNHLGNVLAVVSDKKLGYSNGNTASNYADYYKAELLSANDYYPYGMTMPYRSFDSPQYRYGFNGKEKDEDDEWGDLMHYDYGFRIYNPGIGRFLSRDPLKSEYPFLTPYQFASNTPIAGVDLDGLECRLVIYRQDYWNDGTPYLKLVADVELEEEGIYGSGTLTIINDSRPSDWGLRDTDDDQFKQSYTVFDQVIEYKQTDENGQETGVRVTEKIEVEGELIPAYYGGSGSLELLSGPGVVGKAAKIGKLQKIYKSVRVAKAIYYSGRLGLGPNRLRKALGIVKGSADRAHHIISVKLLKNNKFIQKGVAQGFDFNGIANGLKINKLYHTGRHVNRYDQGILSLIEANKIAYPKASAKKILEITAGQVQNMQKLKPKTNINNYF